MNFIPRLWQAECFTKAWAWLVTEAKDRHFLVNACPGAGKTLMGAYLARELLAQNLITRVIVIAPRNAVVTTWAKDFQAMTGRPMMKLTGQSRRSAKLYPDICATWAGIAGLLPEMQAICEHNETLVICDEHHHAAFAAAWGISADSAFRKAKYAIALTGTPIRSDGNGMQWFELEDTGSLAVPENGCYALPYDRSIEEGYCRPMVFHRHPGEFLITTDNGAKVRVASTGHVGISGDYDHAKVKAFDDYVRMPNYVGGRPAIPSYHQSMMVWAGKKLDEIRHNPPALGGLSNAGGLVAAASIDQAEYFADLIEMIEGKPPMIVHSRISNSEELIDAFRKSKTHRWLITVNMVNEGVDIPRLRVIVNVSRARTELYFRQLAGRAVRINGKHDCSRGYMVIPEVPKLVEWAENYEREQKFVEPKIKALDGIEAGGDPAKGPEGESANEPKDWSCKGCNALNPPHSDSCHACGLAKRKKEPREVPVYEISESDGRRDGVVAGGIFYDENSVLESERLAGVFEDLEKATPGIVATILKRFRPEELAMIPQIADQLRAADKAKQAREMERAPAHENNTLHIVSTHVDSPI
jgi:superfamily II DNA or RNA helicase